MNEIQVWDFNLDDYLFEYLENGYDIFIIDYKHILYIDLYINYNLEDIEYIDGLSKYIEYKEKELQDEKYLEKQIFSMVNVCTIFILIWVASSNWMVSSSDLYMQ